MDLSHIPPENLVAWWRQQALYYRAAAEVGEQNVSAAQLTRAMQQFHRELKSEMDFDRLLTNPSYEDIYDHRLRAVDRTILDAHSDAILIGAVVDRDGDQIGARFIVLDGAS